MKIRPKLPYFLFFFIISIVGCAVLKIDVDVYKGSLSNSEDMQGKQLVAMVAGTKDLLVQLRNNLELESLEKNKEILQDNEYEKRKELITNLKGWINVNIVGTATVSGIGYTTDKNGHLVKSAPMQYISRTMQGTTTVITYTLNFKDTTFDTSYDIFTSKLASNVNDVLEFFAVKEKKNNTEFMKYLEEGEIGTDTTKLRDELLSFAENVLMLVKYRTAMENISFIKDSLKVNSYVTVLQAIGNSIISQLNELQYQKAYEDKIQKPSAMKNELWAMKQATTPQPNEVLDGILKEVEASGEKAMEEMKIIKKKLQELGAPFTGRTEVEFNDYYGTSTKISEYVTKMKDEYLDKSGTWTTAYELLREDSLEDKYAGVKSRRPFYTILYKDILKNGTPTTMVNFIGSITAKLEEEINKEIREETTMPIEDSPRIKYLSDVKSYLSDDKDVKDFSAKVGSDAPENLYKKQLYEKFLNEKFVERNNSKDDYNKAIKVKEEADKFLEAKDKKTKLTNAKDKILEVKSDVLSKFNTTKERPTSEIVIWQLKAVLQAKGSDTAKNDADGEAYKDISQVVTECTQSIMDIKVADDNDAKDTKDVFDQMVALLRHQHIQAVRNYGANSRQANDIDEALQLAYSYRSNMVYIRPPSAYLRNSYPSTSLQSNPGLAWKNMLGEHAWRSTPFIDNVLDLTGNKSQRGLAIADIDKQYWQNINSVRVAGAGRTNYVVAKDDIGNWYVKRYSSNPEDIIQSAKKLALFNLNAMMNPDLVSRLSSKIDKVPEVAGKKPEANRSTLEQIFDKYEGQYTEKTNIDYDNLRTILGTSSTQTSSTLETKIVDVWGKDEDTKKVIEKLKSKLTSAAEINLRSASKELPENLDEEEKDKKPKDKKTRAERIISALREIKQFHSRLISGIHDLELTKGPNEELDEATKEKNLTSAKNAEKFAIKSATYIVRDVLMKVVEERIDVVGNYETGIIFIGDAIKKNK